MTESQIELGWKGSTGSSSPTPGPVQHHPKGSHHVPEGIVHVLFSCISAATMPGANNAGVYPGQIPRLQLSPYCRHLEHIKQFPAVILWI